MQTTVRNLLLVGTGGFVGSICRYLLSGVFQNAGHNPWFPYGTVGVNVLGCLCIGLLGGWADNMEAFNPSVRLFLFLGLLGGFTTFSTFSYETVALLRDRQMLAALANVALHLVLGLAAVWVGYAVSNMK